MNIKVQVGNRIKEIRENNGISQKDLSYTADLDRSYIASVESGQRNISIVNLQKIANALNINLSQLFQGI